MFESEFQIGNSGLYAKRFRVTSIGDIVKCCGWARSGGVFLNHQSILENLSI